MGEVTSITRFRSRDGKEFARREDAEEHDTYLLAEGMIYRATRSPYSPDYDGPMPMPERMSAEWMFRHRALLRNIFLDLPEPPPLQIVKREEVVRYTTPFLWMLVSLVFGIFIGAHFL